MLSALLLVLSITTSLKSADFYVSKTGNDMTGDGSLANPWLTIQKACDEVTAGSTVFIKAGTYFEELFLNAAGTMGAPIIFKPFQMDEVIIDGTNNLLLPTVLLQIEDASYIQIEGLKFRNAYGEGASGIIIEGTSNNIQITGNEISNIVGSYAIGILVRGASSVITIQGNNISAVHFSSVALADPAVAGDNANPLLIYGNDAFSADIMNPDPAAPITTVAILGNTIHDCRTGFSEGLTLNGNVDGFTVAYNTLFNLSNIGIDAAGGYGVSGDPSQDFARNGTITSNFVQNWTPPPAGLDVAAGIYVDGGQNIVVELNRVYNYGRGYEIGCENLGWVTSNIMLRNNIAANNRQAGIGIGGYAFPEFTGKVIDCQVFNNTCYHNSKLGPFNEGELVIDYTENCEIKNNIFYAQNPLGRLLLANLNTDDDESVDLVLDYNLYYTDPFIIGGDPLLIEVNWYNQLLTITTFGELQTAIPTQNVHSRFGNPNFKDVASNDFHLGPNSKAYNGGDPMFVPVMDELDIDGQMRIVNTVIDNGADESAIDLPVQYSRPLFGYPVQSGIQLQWATAVELNALRYDIERSSDGVSYEKIGAVSAKGTVTAQNEYGFLDKSPLPGTNYYRLNQIDIDGRSNIGNVATVKWESTLTGVFPNPTPAHFDIRSAGGWEKVVLKNNLGQVVRTITTGQETTLAGLQSGVYRLEVYEKEGAVPQVFSLIKQ